MINSIKGTGNNKEVKLVGHPLSYNDAATDEKVEVALGLGVNYDLKPLPLPLSSPRSGWTIFHISLLVMELGCSHARCCFFSLSNRDTRLSHWPVSALGWLWLVPVAATQKGRAQAAAESRAQGWAGSGLLRTGCWRRRAASPRWAFYWNAAGTLL